MNVAKRKKRKKKGGVQWIFSNQDVALRSVLVLGDDPSADGEDRVEDREPEPLPHHCMAQLIP